MLFIGILGTDAWIDAAGYLWQKDYIADKDGFRILKNKKIFVGQSRPIKVENFRVHFCFVLFRINEISLFHELNRILSQMDV